MKQALPLLRVMTGGIVLLSATAADAVTLGALRGAAVLGQPLRLVVETTLPSAEEMDPKCLGVEFLYGDTAISPLRTRALMAEGGGASSQRALRLEADEPVNEPIVTVTVRAGCSPRVQRQYTLFADPGHGDAGVPRTATSGVILPPANPAAQVRQAESGGTPALASGSGTTAAAATAPATRPPKASAAAHPRPERPAAKAQLKLDMLDDLESRPALLKQSWSLSAWQEGPHPKRDEAARWWSVLNAEPSRWIEQSLQAKQYEEQIRLLKLANEKERQQQQRLSEQLLTAEESRYANPLVYALTALGVLSTTAALWAGLRLRRKQVLSRPWWQAADPPMSDNMPLDKAAPATKPAPVAVPAAAPADGWFDRLRRGIGAQPGTASPKARRFGGENEDPARHDHGSDIDSDLSPLGFSQGLLSSYVETPRTARTEELFDIQQQADFFVSLGQQDQAIELLIHHIRDNEETSPMAYLDLLKIYHSLGRQREYDQIRETFNRIYTAAVPAMEDFNQPTYGLEAYPSALNRIEALWPSAKVLDVIEESIFRKPGQNPRNAFTLEAYRELLLLHAIVKGYIEPPSVVLAESRRSSWQDQQERSAKPEFGDTQVNPLSTTEFINSVQPDLQRDLASGLDIDLEALEPEGAATAGPAAARAAVDNGLSLDLVLSEPTDHRAPPSLDVASQTIPGADIDLRLDEWLSAEAERNAQDMPSLDFDLSQFDPAEPSMPTPAARK